MLKLIAQFMLYWFCFMLCELYCLFGFVIVVVVGAVIDFVMGIVFFEIDSQWCYTLVLQFSCNWLCNGIVSCSVSGFVMCVEVFL